MIDGAVKSFMTLKNTWYLPEQININKLKEKCQSHTKGEFLFYRDVQEIKLTASNTKISLHTTASVLISTEIHATGFYGRHKHVQTNTRAL